MGILMHLNHTLFVGSNAVSADERLVLPDTWAHYRNRKGRI